MDVILQDLFEMKTLLIPHKTAWSFLWDFFEGWVYNVATMSVGEHQKTAELSTRFQMSSYMYI